MMRIQSMARRNYDSFSRRNVSSSQQHDQWTANAYFKILQILNITYYHFGLPRFVVKSKQTDLLRVLWEAWVRDNTPSTTARWAVYSVILQAESALGAFVVGHMTLRWLRLVRFTDIDTSIAVSTSWCVNQSREAQKYGHRFRGVRNQEGQQQITRQTGRQKHVVWSL
jgi:hypothetical protein